MSDPLHPDIPALMPVLTEIMETIEKFRARGTNVNALINALLNAQMMVILTDDAQRDPIGAAARCHETLVGMIQTNIRFNQQMGNWPPRKPS